MKASAEVGKGVRGGRLRLAMIALALALVALALPASASAGLYHPKPSVASFGPLGGSCAEGKLATGTGDLAAATGKGDLSTLATGAGTRSLLASGKGDLTEGSKTVANLTTSTGAFSVGQSIFGNGIPFGTTIEAIGAGTLTLSAPATESKTGTQIRSGSKTITGLTTATGAFSVGQSISGEGIPFGDTIAATGPGTLTLSVGATFAGSGSLASGSKTINNVTASEGAFAVGMRISTPNGGGNFQQGEGFFTTIAAVGAGTLTLSAGVTSAAAGAGLQAGSTEVTSVATGCGTFEVGQKLGGSGLSEPNTITAIGPGTLALSRPPTKSGTAVPIAAESSFESLDKLAFDQADHRLYAIEHGGNANGGGGSGSVYELYGFDLFTPGSYTPLGAPFPLSIPHRRKSNPSVPASIAVDDSDGPTQGNLYVANPEEIFGFDSTGAPLPGFPIASPPSSPQNLSPGWNAVAVDPDGNLWAASEHNFNGAIFEYSSAGVLLNQVPLCEGTFSAGRIFSLAFDSTGDLYAGVSCDSGSGVYKISAPAYENPVPFLEGIGVVASGLTVDRASGDLYAASQNQIRRYRSDGALLEEFATGLGSGIRDIALDEATKTVYSAFGQENGGKIQVFAAFILPDLAFAPLSNPTATTLTLHGGVHPDGLPLSSCKFEYVTEAAYQATGFTSLASGGEHACEPAFGSIPTSGTTPVSAALSGLSEGVHYRYRLSAADANGTNTTKGLPGSFALARPAVETVGSPIRTATSARLDSRVDPHGIATAYRFEYLTDAAYQANLAASQPPFQGAETTPSHPAGEGVLTELVSQEIDELTPATTYRYRVVADNGAFGGAATGEARTLTTRTSDQPLSHGPYPGPPGSDRAWEQVNLPDTSGNPVKGAAGIAADGDSAVYQVTGGTSVSETGTLFDFLFARRPPDGPDGHPTSGWQTESVFPSRFAATFNAWYPPAGDNSLSTLLALNIGFEEGSGAAVWRIPTEGGAPAKLYEAKPGKYLGPYLFSDDGSRALLGLEGAKVDEAHKSPGSVAQLYDVASGTPHMVSLLPGAGPGAEGPSCGVNIGKGHIDWLPRSSHWLSADGSHAFFTSSGNEPCGPLHLYMRDFAEEETFRVDGPPLSGPDCSGALIRSTPEAAYFWTQSRLTAADSAIAGGCGGASPPGGDVYRYDLAGHGLQCLTCVAPGGLPANVDLDADLPVGPSKSIAVAPDGSRLYFTTETRLLPGAAETGTRAIYRVDTETHQLAYVGPLNPGEVAGENPSGSFAQGGSAISADGRFFAFASASPGLDALTGSDNGGTVQDYVYDDAERSLSCASCPADGSAPRAAAANGITGETEPGANLTSLAENGDFAFATPTALVGADQNTAGPGEDPSAGADIYEWRDGRALLVSNGLTEWPSNLAAPNVATIDPSGRDLFFTEAAQLTPDALDGYRRLYDARIGGGIDFPEAKQPCSLEACQGTPKGAPAEAAPGSASFSGPGNVKEEGAAKPRCSKGKVRRKGRCVAKKHKRAKRAHHRAAKGNRRNSR